MEHTGAWAAADVTATDVTTELGSLRSGLTNLNDYLFSSEILSNADLNNYKTSASYRIGNISTCTNGPDSSIAGSSGVFEIEVHGAYILQKFYGDKGYTQRVSYDHGTTWVAWDSRLTNKQDKTDNTLTTTAKTVVGAINELNGIFIHHDFSGPDTKETITSLIAFIRDNTQTGHTYVLDGLFTDTTTTTTHNYNAVVTKMSSYVYGIVNYGNNIYNIDYLAGTYKTIMQFTGTAL